ncbi:hypothetical protein T440DRAFT_480803 [Plenodomus tracheiphilus IPT5]|uniref:Uncharacterized protein n=1 Tax=Plenodomus tracheiphilus IPT5 TaxID=1408161 RepID=A0A6A7AYU6_9PLEO|nr:hypothetical protein T440DRAFT_480803 [Plenodomus tracheiphilus IPT5]
MTDSVNSFVQGYNVLILAYGQSGAASTQDQPEPRLTPHRSFSGDSPGAYEAAEHACCASIPHCTYSEPAGVRLSTSEYPIRRHSNLGDKPEGEAGQSGEEQTSDDKNEGGHDGQHDEDDDDEDNPFANSFLGRNSASQGRKTNHSSSY